MKSKNHEFENDDSSSTDDDKLKNKDKYRSFSQEQLIDLNKKLMSTENLDKLNKSSDYTLKQHDGIKLINK